MENASARGAPFGASLGRRFGPSQGRAHIVPVLRYLEDLSYREIAEVQLYGDEALLDSGENPSHMKRVQDAQRVTLQYELLRQNDVDTIILCGQHTHICVRHSSYGALIRGYEITIPRDAVCAFEGVSEDEKKHAEKDL